MAPAAPRSLQPQSSGCGDCPLSPPVPLAGARAGAQGDPCEQGQGAEPVGAQLSAPPGWCPESLRLPAPLCPSLAVQGVWCGAHPALSSWDKGVGLLLCPPCPPQPLPHVLQVQGLLVGQILVQEHSPGCAVQVPGQFCWAWPSSCTGGCFDRAVGAAGVGLGSLWCWRDRCCRVWWGCAMLGQAGFGSGGTGTVQLQGGSCWVWLRWDWGRPAPEAALLGLASSSRIAGAGAAGGLGGIVFAAIVLVLFEDSPVSFSGAGGAARGWPSPEGGGGGGGSGRSPPPCSGSLRLRQSERRSLRH